MNLQMVTTTDVQRNFKKILDNDQPVIVMRDSKPKKVVMEYQEYLRMKKFEDDRLGREFEEALDRMQSRNKGIDEKKLDKILREALHAAGRD